MTNERDNTGLKNEWMNELNPVPFGWTEVLQKVFSFQLLKTTNMFFQFNLKYFKINESDQFIINFFLSAGIWFAAYQ